MFAVYRYFPVHIFEQRFHIINSHSIIDGRWMDDKFFSMLNIVDFYENFVLDLI